MKRFLTLMAMVSAIAAFSSCNKDNGNDTGIPTGDGDPTITWESNPNFETQEITATGMDVKISVAAPAGISSFVVTIDSDALEGILQTNTIDFINPSGSTAGIVSMIVGADVTVKGATELNLDLSSLIPMILMATNEDSNHTFKLDVTDASGKTVSATAKFHRSAAEIPTTSQAE